MINRKSLLHIPCFLLFLLSSCSIQQQIGRSARAELLENRALKSAHVGISIFDPEENRFLYEYQGQKYFVPASNTKIPTCYAAMKYLGEKLRGLDFLDTDTVCFIRPTADPTFLHRDYPGQPVFDFLKTLAKPLAFIYPKWEAEMYGDGWSWNDYNEYYMAERSALPVYGNVIEYSIRQLGNRYELNGDINFFRYALSPHVDPITPRIRIQRKKMENTFEVYGSRGTFSKVQIPFQTLGNRLLLEDTLKKAWLDQVSPPVDQVFRSVYSQPTDSMLKPMMHRSDNFFAEQALLMVSNEKLGLMNDEKIIDTLLKTDFSDLPQAPRWVDGSGLSRYNLFSPRDFVMILRKMKDEFGMERVKEIFPTGGEGSIRNYYTDAGGYIFGKTGTLSGVVAFSGFLYTKKGKLLIFSTLVNNHKTSATEVRRAVEKFLTGIRNGY